MVKFAILTAISRERPAFLQRRMVPENILLKRELYGRVSKTVQTKLVIERYYDTFGANTSF
jgi:hypothetical protein